MPVAGLKQAVLGLALTYIAWSFLEFSCTSYGMQRPLKEMEYLMWLSSWELAY